MVIDPDSLSLRTRTDVEGRYRITVPRGRFEVRVVRIGLQAAIAHDQRHGTHP